LLAILRDDRRPSFARATKPRSSAYVRGNFLEAAIVVDGSRDPIASRRFDDFVRESTLSSRATEAQRRIARRLP